MIVNLILTPLPSSLAELWAEVEHYVHLVEGSISVQEWRGVGETWQWQAGSGWQGSGKHLSLSSPRSSTTITDTTNSLEGQPRGYTANSSCAVESWYWRWGQGLNYPPPPP